MAIVTPDFVFIHVPRTGGTSARAAILETYPHAFDTNRLNAPVRKDAAGVVIPPEQHIAASKLERRSHAALIKGKRMIGFVRHPLSWYMSMWAWAKRTHFAEKIAVDPFAERHWLAGVWSDELKTFIDNVIAMQVPRAWVVFHEKLTRADGSMCELGRFESLHADVYKLTGCTITTRLRQSNEKAEITKSQSYKISELERDTVNKFYGAQSIAEKSA